MGIREKTAAFIAVFWIYRMPTILGSARCAYIFWGESNHQRLRMVNGDRVFRTTALKTIKLTSSVSLSLSICAIYQ